MASYDAHTALVVVDVQNDFADAAGSLYVGGAEEVLPVINREIEAALTAGATIVYTQDWHPPSTPHFQKDGGIWPVHCVADSWGAQFHPGLTVAGETIKKGTGGEDGYSGFTVRDPTGDATASTGLDELLRGKGIERVVVAGLATDYCVKETALDAAAKGYDTVLLRGAARAVDLEPGDGERAIAAMAAAGVAVEPAGGRWLDDAGLGLFTDLYELTMAAAYHRAGMTGLEATFDLFVRRLPPARNFLVAAGLEDALRYLENVAFDAAALSYLEGLELFEPAFLDLLGGLRFTGDVHAVAEGEVVFAGEPLLCVTAPLIEAQLAETALINAVGFQTMIASKAARVALACGPDRSFVDFGARRAHGTDAALKAARAAFIGGAAGTSLVLAGREFGIPVQGTMAHSYVQAHSSEYDAFANFARTFGDAVLLIDTYDTVAGARAAIAVADDLAAESIRVGGVRLDSGDLAALAAEVRSLLDGAGHPDMAILASGDLDEVAIRALADAPIDAFGVGTRLVTSSDAPHLDIVYKLAEANGPTAKISPGKATVAGRKQVFRHADHDVIAERSEGPAGGRPLLEEVMRGGRRASDSPPLPAVRDRCLRAAAALPAHVREPEPAADPWRVDVSARLEELTGAATRRATAS